MKITEIRKAIIELIEPYMDKTFEMGLLYMDYKGEYGVIGETWLVDGEYVTQHGLGLKDLDKMMQWGYKIKGCYDITAVLHYIDKKGYWIEFDCGINENEKYFIIKDDVSYDANLIGKIPAKALHLFTDEEDKNLLELLKELCIKKN